MKGDATKRAQWLAEHAKVFSQVPEARQAALDAGLMQTLERWASGAEAGAQPSEVQLAVKALNVIGQLKPDEAELRRVVVAVARQGETARRAGRGDGRARGQGKCLGHRSLARRDSRKAWSNRGSTCGRPSGRRPARSRASTIPGLIPTMIAVIDADNTYDTVYGVGYFGLGRLTGVAYDESHDGAWWRQWWEKNKERYPEAARNLEVPRLPEAAASAEPAPADPLADVADVPAQDLRAGGDEKKRYFLIGAKEAPAAGRGIWAADRPARRRRLGRLPAVHPPDSQECLE